MCGQSMVSSRFYLFGFAELNKIKPDIVFSMAILITIIIFGT